MTPLACYQPLRRVRVHQGRVRWRSLDRQPQLDSHCRLGQLPRRWAGGCRLGIDCAHSIFIGLIGREQRWTCVQLHFLGNSDDLDLQATWFDHHDIADSEPFGRVRLTSYCLAPVGVSARYQIRGSPQVAFFESQNRRVKPVLTCSDRECSLTDTTDRFDGVVTSHRFFERWSD